MIDLVEKFIETTQQQVHMQPLLAKADLSVDFITGCEKISIGIQNGTVFLNNGIVKTANTYQVIGKAEELRELLEGDERLRRLADQSKLSIQAPFRTLLLLEGIFYLSKIPKQ